MGNGGDNGNGSAGTFYEGVITSGYPTDAAINAVQANIVAARYDVQRVRLSRVTTFTPKSTQDVTVTFTNTTGSPAEGVKLGILPPARWSFTVFGDNESSAGATEAEKLFTDPVAPGMTVSATFKVNSSATTNGGYLTGKTEWKNQTTGQTQSATIAQRVRNVLPVKINEVRLSTGTNPTNQFIELYNASDNDVDISNWNIINTKSEWDPIKLATIPADTNLKAKGFYLLGLSGSGLVAPAKKGDTTICVRDISGFEVGQKIDIDGETRTIKNIGTPATAMTTLFIPVSTGPWLTFPAGSTNLPVTNAAGFAVGQKIGIDIGGNYEEATITAVGKAATQTTLSSEAKAGETTIKVAANSNMTVGDTLTIDTGGRKELIKVKSIINSVAAPSGGRGGFGRRGGGEAGEVELTAPLKFDHMLDVDISDTGTGISFTPATRFPHKSGDAVQALGSGITLDSALNKSHEYGAAIVNTSTWTVGYQGPPSPNQWFGDPLSTRAGSIALMDASGKVVVDAMVYGSQQSNSSGNGTITSPEIAILEGDQSQGGCIVVAPSAGRGGFGRRGGSATDQANKSLGRFPDGKDTDSNCHDFLLQKDTTLSAASPAGANNIKVTSVADFGSGQIIIIDTGENRETAVIEEVGTAGGTTISTAIEVGATVIPVANTGGFSVGQTITIGSGANRENAVVAAISGGARGGFGGGRGGRGGTGGAAITITSPLAAAQAVGTQVSGTGITLTTALIMAHNSGTQVAGGIPTPGAPNQYYGGAQ